MSERFAVVEKSRYVLVAEIREALGCNRNTMWRWLKRLDIPVYHFVGDARGYILRSDAVRLGGAHLDSHYKGERVGIRGA